MPECALCKKDKKLCESHIYPKFVIKWLKDTSLTGHLRNPNDSNRRIQDGYKLHLLCNDCELIISKYETAFNNKIFKPFTEQHLDVAGRIIYDGYIEYDDWLKKFCISVAWRSFVSNYYTDYPVGFSEAVINRINYILEKWRSYLLGDSKDFGDTTSYLLFLRNLDDGEGELPPDISPNINNYLIRFIDGALIYDDKILIDMSKLGPIMFLTSIIPGEIDGYPNSKINNVGIIKIEQNWTNAILNRYLFVERPNEIDQLRIITEKQYEQIQKSINKNIDRIDKAMTLHVIKSDINMKPND